MIARYQSVRAAELCWAHLRYRARSRLHGQPVQPPAGAAAGRRPRQVGSRRVRRWRVRCRWRDGSRRRRPPSDQEGEAVRQPLLADRGDHGGRWAELRPGGAAGGDPPPGAVAGHQPAQLARLERTVRTVPRLRVTLTATARRRVHTAATQSRATAGGAPAAVNTSTAPGWSPSSASSSASAWAPPSTMYPRPVVANRDRSSNRHSRASRSGTGASVSTSETYPVGYPTGRSVSRVIGPPAAPTSACRSSRSPLPTSISTSTSRLAVWHGSSRRGREGFRYRRPDASP